MLSIAHAVEKIISEKPFIQEGLSRGIINNAALASEMIPQVEQILKRKVKFSAVNMSIRRLSEKLEKRFTSLAHFDQNADVTLRSDLIQIVIHKMEDVQDHIRKVYDLVDYKKGDFLTITQGIYELMIITNSRHEKQILQTFPRNQIKKTFRNLSGITIRLPDDGTEMVGLFYLITRALAWENIVIVDFVSTYTEATLTFNERDSTRAYETLKRLVERQNKD
ncbi:hypothetical protein HY990_06760 [Candidatus Micrarchaeota archaeon]|nr:hypothetical protein [Candidatus Micrarchaeota archaeon]